MCNFFLRNDEDHFMAGESDQTPKKFMFACVLLSFFLSILATGFEFNYVVTALHLNTTNDFMISNPTNI